MRPVAFIYELRRVAGSIIRSVFQVRSRWVAPWRRKSRQMPEADGTPEGLRHVLDHARAESRMLLADEVMRMHGKLGGPDAGVSIKGRIDRTGSARVLGTLRPDLSDPQTVVRDDRFHACLTSADAEDPARRSR